MRGGWRRCRDWGTRCGAEQEADRTAAVSLILEHLARARLVTIDEETIELAHEALITAWPRLRAWSEEDRGGCLYVVRQGRGAWCAGVWDGHAVRVTVGFLDS
ncbi:hypothetical protein AB0L80_40520 [Streptomyces sp. NPDC052069]|uniref:nSTAND1 domain-containing NTPase n=1 Tax=Streptomyces sp. NPDC052069 TaxID=3154650 RepID=UPI0034395EC3